MNLSHRDGVEHICGVNREPRVRSKGCGGALNAYIHQVLLPQRGLNVPIMPIGMDGVDHELRVRVRELQELVRERLIRHMPKRLFVPHITSEAVGADALAVGPWESASVLPAWKAMITARKPRLCAFWKVVSNQANVQFFARSYMALRPARGSTTSCCGRDAVSSAKYHCEPGTSKVTTAVPQCSAKAWKGHSADIVSMFSEPVRSVVRSWKKLSMRNCLADSAV
eukprot:CAMPEP_0115736456 /NCGR_PEP_ID=MMETSP0272-20121206/87272_1 /TAXON_ID=71861 /ORGANISM="Scrippsiella trochoidea, Strain CCMP3099" /LENGTH=224 /DNA_ID=CAMNT_0003180649 /DNA_START=85 /DNA_END=759 /DNA_ORIENTATION=+